MTDAPFFPLLFQAPAKFVLEEAIASVSTGWSRVQNTLAGRGAEADAARQDAVAAASLAERVLTGPPTTQRCARFNFLQLPRGPYAHKRPYDQISYLFGRYRLMLIRLCFDTMNDAYVLKDGTAEDAAELVVSMKSDTGKNFHFSIKKNPASGFFQRTRIYFEDPMTFFGKIINRNRLDTISSTDLKKLITCFDAHSLFSLF
jgi:hypothetical protein